MGYLENQLPLLTPNDLGLLHLIRYVAFSKPRLILLVVAILWVHRDDTSSFYFNDRVEIAHDTAGMMLDDVCHSSASAVHSNENASPVAYCIYPTAKFWYADHDMPVVLAVPEEHPLNDLHQFSVAG